MYIYKLYIFVCYTKSFQSYICVLQNCIKTSIYIICMHIKSIYYIWYLYRLYRYIHLNLFNVKYKLGIKHMSSYSLLTVQNIFNRYSFIIR